MNSIIALNLYYLIVGSLFVLDQALEVHYLKSISGKSVSIPCRTSDWDENEVLLVLWYRENSAVPFYKLDSRNRQLSKAKHILISNDLSNRFFFDVSSDPPVLRINPVLIPDEGEYRCRVDYKTKRTQSFSIFMEVFGPPTEVLILDEHNESLDRLIGPFDEFSYITLICEARDGNPNPSVIWYQTGILEVVIDSTYSVNSTGLVRNELTLRRLDRHDYRSKLTCRASSSGLYEPIDKSVIIDMNLKPLSVEILTKNSPLIAGVIAQFGCSSQGSRPAANIVWMIGEKTLEEVTNTVDDEGNSTLSLVSFVPTVEHNNQFLICRAINERLSDSVVETQIQIVVEYEPRIEISFDVNYEERDIIKEGNYVRVFCKVTANPEVESLVWAVDGKHIRDPYLLDNNQTLVIKNINKSNDGKYQCTARNSIGTTISEVLGIEVKYVPICGKGQQIYYNVVRNLINRIHCSVNTQPEDRSLRFKWFVNTSIDMFELKTFESLEDTPTTSVAYYTPKTVMNFAMVLCLAENDVGVQREPCLFYLKIDNGPPEPVRNCEISNKSQTIISVECMGGNNGGMAQTFHLEVYNTFSEQLHSNYSSSQPNFIVDGLSSDTVYNFVVYSSNPKGNSIGLTYHSIRLPSMQVSQKELNPLLNSLIGIVSSIVIFCVIVVIVIRIRAYIYEDEYSVRDKYDPNKRSSEDSEEIDNLDRENLMRAQTSDTGNNTRISALKKLSNRLKATKHKTYEGIGRYTKVADNEKKIVKFATIEELSDDLDEEPFNERPVDVEPQNKVIESDLDYVDDQFMDAIEEETNNEPEEGEANEEEKMEPLQKPPRRDNTRRSKFFKRSFFRNSFRKTL